VFRCVYGFSHETAEWQVTSFRLLHTGMWRHGVKCSRWSGEVKVVRRETYVRERESDRERERILIFSTRLHDAYVRRG
jgi:hypothetical protein